MLKAIASRVTQEGETLQMEVQAKHPADLQAAIHSAFDILDARLHVQNQRIMAANMMVRKLSPEQQQAVHSVYDVLHGRRLPLPSEMVMQLVATSQDGKLVIDTQSDAPMETGAHEYDAEHGKAGVLEPQA